MFSTQKKCYMFLSILLLNFELVSHWLHTMRFILIFLNCIVWNRIVLYKRKNSFIIYNNTDIQYYSNVWQHFISQKIKIIFSQYSNTHTTQKLYMFQQTYSVHMRQTDWVQFHFNQDINDILSFQRQSSAWNIQLLHSSVHTSMYIIYVYGTENQENLDCVDLFSWINKNWKKLCAVNT